MEVLNENMGNYVKLTHNFIEESTIYESFDFKRLDSLVALISNNAIRITIINDSGVVLYDSKIEDYFTMENHLLRPEIQQAVKQPFGSDIRISGTTNIKYYYYAKKFPAYFIRVSAEYILDASRFVNPDRLFLLITILGLLAATLVVLLITDKFGKSMSTLREFTLKATANKPIDEKLVFPNNELGDIGQEIIEIYQSLNRTKEELMSEKAKLIRHLNLLDEGIAIFSKDKQVITSNNHFIQSINHISDTRVFTADEFYRIPDFAPIISFVNKYLKDYGTDLSDIQPTYEITLMKNGRYFSVKCIVFSDKSFEVSVNDISKPTKRKVLKQQITENIAHELKTPVSSIRGFLETILEGSTDAERTTDYLRRAYSQSCRLADLINDISILTKIEEAASLYQVEEINLEELIRDVADETQSILATNDILLEVKVSPGLKINGNYGLLYSVFRNLFDNAINYAGKCIAIHVENYTQDNDFHYFSFYDTGIGVPESDLPRLFERFYRVDKGRDRKKGGTGLGLAIVKNAIQFHKGDISVKNRVGGGLEYLFTLARDLRSSDSML
jgi:two-component system OmpR family sensor kinase/two-component system phosphate regulon sensor histidine kinase PhoR